MVLRRTLLFLFVVGALESRVARAQHLPLWATLTNISPIPRVSPPPAPAPQPPQVVRRHRRPRRTEVHPFVFDPPKPRIALPALHLPSALSVTPTTWGALHATGNFPLGNIGPLRPEVGFLGSWLPAAENTEFSTMLRVYATAEHGWTFLGQVQGNVSARTSNDPNGSAWLSITTPRIGPIAIGFDGQIFLSTQGWADPRIRATPRVGIVGGPFEVVAAVGVEAVATHTLPIASISLSVAQQ